ncbi:MAG: hypothetical protein BroJett018_37130 [Chloroflexota bacterium]|nr:hypothetical protein [Chloroflexota bacterium]NOG64240.1 hypothetical protein [Chloroflexota bacterium]GIK65919.1 MAG: hypothetical protein BroJett018_37130 [Chloroflexota bacterium]
MPISRRTFFKGAGALLIGQALHYNTSYAFSTPESKAARNMRQTAGRPLLMVHYMPWYQTPEISYHWGWHWTMEHFNPRVTDENGRPEIASHYMPLTGPYDSSDPDLLEYQVLLMKLSGIDGVIVDWYGIENFRDYADLNDATIKLFEYIEQAGLLFSLCYEDQTVMHMVESGHIEENERLTYGQADMNFAQKQWFTKENYLKANGQPLLFTFGPQYFKSASDWETLFTGLEPQPALITLDKHNVSNALCSYPWPPIQGGVTYNRAAIEAYLSDFYRKAARKDFVVGGAFPGFHDIYAEAGVRDSYGYLDAEGGETFRYTLQMALDQNPDIVQLITWNDYGEGTIIEPTEEFGYQYLAMLQETRSTFDGANFAFTAEQLELPLRLFKLRKAHIDDSQLDEVFSKVISGDIEAANSILDSYSE